MGTSKVPWLRWTIENASSSEADLYIYDVIGDPFFGTTAADFVRELRDVKASKINLHIKSEGGYVDDALEMYNAIQQHPANVTAYIGALAASAASFVAMAANEVLIARNAKMMIHDAMGIVLGNAKIMRETAALFDEESDNIADVYAQRTETDKGTWRERMQANDGQGTTYRGQEAVDVGLADGLISNTQNLKLDRIAALAGDVDDDEDDDLDEFDFDSLPPLAASASYKKPAPDLEGLLTKHPIKVGGPANA